MNRMLATVWLSGWHRQRRVLGPACGSTTCALQITQREEYGAESRLKAMSSPTVVRDVLVPSGVEALAALLMHPVCTINRLNISKNKLDGAVAARVSRCTVCARAHVCGKGWRVLTLDSKLGL